MSAAASGCSGLVRSDPLRAAIVGAGPSGFYAAAQLLAVDARVFAVDLFDRLPSPYGLVHAGAAPIIRRSTYVAVVVLRNRDVAKGSSDIAEWSRPNLGDARHVRTRSRRLAVESDARFHAVLLTA